MLATCWQQNLKVYYLLPTCCQVLMWSFSQHENFVSNTKCSGFKPELFFQQKCWSYCLHTPDLFWLVEALWRNCRYSYARMKMKKIKVVNHMRISCCWCEPQKWLMWVENTKKYFQHVGNIFRTGASNMLATCW